MTSLKARQNFLEQPIVVQLGDDKRSHDEVTWLKTEIENLPGVQLRFVELDDPSPFGIKVFHRGDVILGQRLKDFVAYVRKLAAD